MSNVYVIGNRLVEIIEDELVNVSEEVGANTQVSRTAILPNVSFRKRQSGRGREEDGMRINEGITVVPMKPVRSMGTNERDGIGYRYLVAIVTGTYRDILDDSNGADWPISTWESAIRRRLHNKRMCDMTLDNSCELRTFVEPGDLPKWASLKDGVDSAFLIVTEYIREGRRSA